MVLVELDDIFGRRRQRRPPAFQFDLRCQQVPALIVDGALGDLGEQPLRAVKAAILAQKHGRIRADQPLDPWKQALSIGLSGELQIGA